MKYYVICLCLRYMARNDMQDHVREYGTVLFGKSWPIRKAIRTILRSKNSGIRNDLSMRFMTLESPSTATLNDVWVTCQNALYLRDSIDVFESFGDITCNEENDVDDDDGDEDSES